MSDTINPIDAILRDYSIMILDGALATELEKHGCDLNDPLWSARVLLENPEVIYQVHSDYFRAGAECARVFANSKQIVAIGINCAPLSVVTEAIKVLRANTQKPIIVYPNSGETYDPETKTWHGSESCNELDLKSEEWYQVGARLIGGCCRTTPHHIEEISKRWRP